MSIVPCKGPRLVNSCPQRTCRRFPLLVLNAVPRVVVAFSMTHRLSVLHISSRLSPKFVCRKNIWQGTQTSVCVCVSVWCVLALPALAKSMYDSFRLLLCLKLFMPLSCGFFVTYSSRIFRFLAGRLWARLARGVWSVLVFVSMFGVGVLRRFTTGASRTSSRRSTRTNTRSSSRLAASPTRTASSMTWWHSRSSRPVSNDERETDKVEQSAAKHIRSTLLRKVRTFFLWRIV